MNDEQIIKRLRSALDEVTAADEPAMATRTESHQSHPARLMAFAAVLVLVLAGTGWIVFNRVDRNTSPAATTPADTAPVTTVARGADDAWYFMGIPDLAPGPVTFEPCCPPTVAPGPAYSVAWAATTGVEDGILLLLVQPTLDGTDTLKYLSYGLSDQRVEELQGEVVRGSGLPYVLPDPGMELVGFGFEGIGAMRSQTYTGADGSVTLSVGDYRGQLTPIVLGGALEPVTIAGQTGSRYEDDKGIHVVWRTPVGTWATLDIDPGLAERAPLLIAAVVEAPTPTDSVPPATTNGTDGATHYYSVAEVIEMPGMGPMIAFAMAESLPPQGGDVPLAGFDWSAVDDEQSMNGTTWGGPYGLVGTWDGTTFTLTEPPAPREFDPAPPLVGPTPGCTDADVAPPLQQIDALDRTALGLIEWSDDRWDGRCGVQVHAMFDTPELQAALGPLGDQVTVTYAFTPTPTP